MNTCARPLILVTNDDGIASPGLHALAAALHPLGELLVVAPQHQQSGAGRSLPAGNDGRLYPTQLVWNGSSVEAFGVGGSPAQAVLHALLEMAPRKPDLVAVGVNYGENLGSGITTSGTVGAALEAAGAGIPALAVSLYTAPEFHYSHSSQIDFSAAAHFAHLFARRLLLSDLRLPFDVDLLKIDVPQSATPHTPWRVTRVSRQEYFQTLPSPRSHPDDPAPLVYRVLTTWNGLEPDSDIQAVIHDGVVSVSPMSLDMSSRVERCGLERLLRGELGPHDRPRKLTIEASV